MTRKFTPDWKASQTPRPGIWAEVPDAQWNDWRWQLSHRVNDFEVLETFINLTDEETEGVCAENKFRLDITPYFASLIDPDDPMCPVRQQVIPKGRELLAFESMMQDSLAEDQHSPVPGLVHRWPFDETSGMNHYALPGDAASSLKSRGEILGNGYPFVGLSQGKLAGIDGEGSSRRFYHFDGL